MDEELEYQEEDSKITKIKISRLSRILSISITNLDLTAFFQEIIYLE